MLFFNLNKTSPNFIEFLSANPINCFKFYLFHEHYLLLQTVCLFAKTLLICFALMNFLSKSIGHNQENKTAFFQLSRPMHLPLGSDAMLSINNFLLDSTKPILSCTAFLFLAFSLSAVSFLWSSKCNWYLILAARTFRFNLGFNRISLKWTALLFTVSYTKRLAVKWRLFHVFHHKFIVDRKPSQEQLGHETA